MPVLRADWPAPANVHAFTTLRHGAGCSEPPFDAFNLGNYRAVDGDDVDAVMRNRAELVQRLALPATPRWMRQVHGVDVLRFAGGASRETMHPQLSSAGAREGAGSEATHADDEPEADASVTATAGVVLAILTADCLPVLLCARDGTEVAAAHAGWRGLADGVIESTVRCMRTPACDLIAWLGPAAGPADYEVGIEVYDAFVSRDWCAGAAFVSTRPLHWRVDLYALARMRLARCGIDPSRVSGGGLSTIADPQRFFSHRRDRRSGRMASVIWMQP